MSGKDDQLKRQVEMSKHTDEDYLKHILQIRLQKGAVRIRDLSEAIGRSDSSVRAAVGKLTERGYVRENEGRGGTVELTEEGRSIAEQILGRHRMIQDWMIRLGIGPEEADEQACQMEHVISDRVISAIQRHVELAMSLLGGDSAYPDKMKAMAEGIRRADREEAEEMSWAACEETDPAAAGGAVGGVAETEGAVRQQASGRRSGGVAKYAVSGGVTGTAGAVKMTPEKELIGFLERFGGMDRIRETLEFSEEQGGMDVLREMKDFIDILGGMEEVRRAKSLIAQKRSEKRLADAVKLLGEEGGPDALRAAAEQINYLGGTSRVRRILKLSEKAGGVDVLLDLTEETLKLKNVFDRIGSSGDV